MDQTQPRLRKNRLRSCLVVMFAVLLLPALLITHIFLIGHAKDAVVSGNIDQLKLIVALDPWVVNAHTNIDPLDDYSLLFQAVSSSRHNIARFLIEKGADVDRECGMNEIALRHAAANNDKRMVELLLKSGANINLKNSIGTTALGAAIDEGHSSIASLLRRHGAKDPSEAHEAAAFGQVSRLKTLLHTNSKSASRKDGTGCTPFFHAARNGHSNCLRTLLRTGAKPGGEDDALHMAVRSGDLESVRLLVTSGIDVNKRDEWGNLPLEEAIDGKNKQVISFLKSCGARSRSK